MKGLRFPRRSEKVPNTKVDIVVAMADIATIQDMMVGSFAIFAYTKVLNHWLSTFHQSWPITPSPQTRAQKLFFAERLFFSIIFHDACGISLLFS